MGKNTKAPVKTAPKNKGKRYRISSPYKKFKQ
jgi:hypothetical protein